MSKKLTTQQDARRMTNALKVAKCYKEELEKEAVGEHIKEIVARRRREKESQRRDRQTRTVIVMPTVQVQMRRCLPGEVSDGMLYPRMECGGVPACNQEQNDILAKLILAGLPDSDEDSIEDLINNNRPCY